MTKKAFIKSLVCAAQGMWDVPCCEGIDVAHFKKGSFAGLNLKNDRRTIPLCRIHHSLQHSLGEKSFWGGRIQAVSELATQLDNAYMNNDADIGMLLVCKFVRGK